MYFGATYDFRCNKEMNEFEVAWNAAGRPFRQGPKRKARSYIASDPVLPWLLKIL